MPVPVSLVVGARLAMRVCQQHLPRVGVRRPTGPAAPARYLAFVCLWEALTTKNRTSPTEQKGPAWNAMKAKAGVTSKWQGDMRALQNLAREAELAVTTTEEATQGWGLID